MPPREQRLDLRGEAKGPAVVRCVEGLDAVRISRQKKATPLLVPDSESKHAPEPMYHLGAITCIEMQERFRVGSRAKVGAVPLELSAELRIVVDLAVEDNDKLTVITCHWLGSSVGKVDDRKPSMAQTAT